MDAIDEKILAYLQIDGQLNNQALADKISLSPSPCSRRVKQLEEQGYINKYVALLNPEKIGLQLTIMVLISLVNHDPKTMQRFEKNMEALPEVIQCYLIAGQSADYLLKVMVGNLNDYQNFLLNKLTLIEGVSQVHSSFVLRRIVDKTTLPLNFLNKQVT